MIFKNIRSFLTQTFFGERGEQTLTENKVISHEVAEIKTRRARRNYWFGRDKNYPANNTDEQLPLASIYNRPKIASIIAQSDNLVSEEFQDILDELGEGRANETIKNRIKAERKFLLILMLRLTVEGVKFIGSARTGAESLLSIDSEKIPETLKLLRDLSIKENRPSGIVKQLGRMLKSLNNAKDADEEPLATEDYDSASFIKKKIDLIYKEFIAAISDEGVNEMVIIFDQIFDDAVARNGDRTRNQTPDKDAVVEDQDHINDAMGLALSGGGIRSSSFCLGAIQGLQRFNLFQNMDYLSTVSGGGYVGASFTSAFSCAPKESHEANSLKMNLLKDNADMEYGSLFRHRLGEEESIFFRYLRNNADYLSRKGLMDLLVGASSLVRGALINISTMLALIVVFAFSYAVLVDSVNFFRNGEDNLLKIYLDKYLSIYFALIFAALAVLPVQFIRSFLLKKQGAQFYRILSKSKKMKTALEDKDLFKKLSQKVLAIAFFALVGAIVIDLFNFIVSLIYNFVLVKPDNLQFLALPSGSLILGGALFATMRNYLLDSVANMIRQKTIQMVSFTILILMLLFIACTVAIGLNLLSEASVLSGKLTEIANSFEPVMDYAENTPSIVSEIMAVGIGATQTSIWFVISIMASLLVLLFAYLFMDINATSLHAFYRDRLAKAFVFTPFVDQDEISNKKKLKVKAAAPLERVLLSNLVSPTTSELVNQNETLEYKNETDAFSSRRNIGPYPLINAAINIDVTRDRPISDNDDVQKNVEEWQHYKKGRRADFFLFSPLATGSKITKFISTETLESKVDIDLATAIAISGAAVSPGAGNRIPKLIGFFLALINARLNFWLPNPSRYYSETTGFINTLKHRFYNIFGSFRPGLLYLISEMFGRSQSDTKLVNISDGGHIENIGLYQLLKRKCRFIVVCDAGRDSELKFGDLSEAMRIAQIDMGIRIEMEGLDEIRSGDQAHAIGKIHYGGDHFGQLLVLKLTLPGDKALEDTLGRDAFLSSPRREDSQLYDAFSYISSYAAKEPDFPHQSTADQFFNEEQFEAYRALGYEVAMSAIAREH